MTTQKICVSGARRTLFIVFLITFFVCSVCFAKPVTLDQAKIVAQNWMAEQTGVSTPSSLTFSATISTTRQAGQATYYIFDLESSGWVIISANDVAYPVIGYSTRGHTNPQKQSPAFTEWMNQVAAQISSAVSPTV